MGKSYTVEGPGFRLTAHSAGKNGFVLEVDGRKRLAAGRVRCGKFSEVGALGKKFRVHRGSDALSCEIESSSVLPFGCEYGIGRMLCCSVGALDFSTDVAALHFGRVGDLALEPLVFTGEIRHAELELADRTLRSISPAAEEKEFYRGNVCPLRLAVEFSDGVQVEYQAGFDLWRHDAASGIDGATAEYALFSDGEGLHLEREVLRYDENAEPEKRPWRFNAVVAWRDASTEKTTIPGRCETIEGCPLSGAWRREFRRRIRRATDDVVLAGADACVCTNPSHLDRAGRGDKAHYTAQEYLASYRWANRTLKKSGHRFTLGKTAADNLLFDVLGMAPRELFPEKEADE